MRKAAWAGREWHPYSVGFTPEQAAVLKKVTDREDIGLGAVIDAVFTEYFPRQFGRPWPTTIRSPYRNQPLQPTRIKSPRQNVLIYGFVLSPEQHRAFRSVLDAEDEGNMSTIVEDALQRHFETLYGVEWPAFDGRRGTVPAPAAS